MRSKDAHKQLARTSLSNSITKFFATNEVLLKQFINIMMDQRSLRDSPILHRVCVGEMLLLKAICDALTH